MVRDEDTRYAVEQVIARYISGDFGLAQATFEDAEYNCGTWVLQKQILDAAINFGVEAAKEARNIEAAQPYLWLALEYYPADRRSEVFLAFYWDGGLEIGYRRQEHETAIRQRAGVPTAGEATPPLLDVRPPRPSLSFVDC
jgi:hypothetical protein